MTTELHRLPNFDFREKHAVLADLMGEQPLHFDQQIVALMLGTCRALRDIHNAGLVHPELAPRNITISGDTRVEIRALASPPANATLIISEPKYASPEMLLLHNTLSGAAHLRSDIYVVGFTWYELLAGRDAVRQQIFTSDERDSDLFWMKWHADPSARLKPLIEVNPSMPQRLSELIERMTAKEPATRPLSLEDIERPLQQLLRQVEITEHPDSAREKRRSAKPKDVTAVATRAPKERFEKRELLGEGGMGVVYRAYDTILNREVALKALRDAQDTTALELFRKEISILARITHPNIVEVYDVGETREKEGKRPYFVMPLLRGVTLDKLISSPGRPLSIGRCVDVISQVCRGLQAAHDEGLVHRDLKPSNLFVLEDDSVKIIDFGMAHLVNAHSTAGLKGTLLYMAPEQVRLERPTPLSDLFSVAVVCFTAMTGRHPFEGTSPEEIANAILRRTPPSASEFNPVVSPALSQVIHKAMAKEPSQRFRSARDFADNLQKAYRNETIECLNPEQIHPPRFKLYTSLQNWSRPVRSFWTLLRRLRSVPVLIAVFSAALLLLPKSIPPEPPRPATGGLTIRNASGVEVQMDDGDWRKAPDGNVAFQARAGRHTIRLRKPGFRTREEQQDFVAGRNIELYLDTIPLEALPSRVTFRVRPADAGLRVTGSDGSEIPLSGRSVELREGKYRATGTAANHQDASVLFDVAAGTELTVEVELAKRIQRPRPVVVAVGGMEGWEDAAHWRFQDGWYVKDNAGLSFYRSGSGKFVFAAPCGRTFLGGGCKVRVMAAYTGADQHAQIDFERNTIKWKVRQGGKTRTGTLSHNCGSNGALWVAMSVGTDVIKLMDPNDGYKEFAGISVPDLDFNRGRFGIVTQKMAHFRYSPPVPLRISRRAVE